MTYLDCWISAATALFSQALAGEPELMESLPRPMDSGAFGFTAMLAGDQEGRFTVLLDKGILNSPLLGEGVEQQTAWGELLREVADAAVGELLAKAGRKCRVEKFEPNGGEGQVSRAFQLKCVDRSWTILVRDEIRDRKKKPSPEPAAELPLSATEKPQGGAASNPGIELLLDVELEATLRFGCRELPLGEILELGPGDVVPLDRHISDPADLIVGDKIVARGEVVLVNGNFGLRVTEVATPRKRLESIRCLF
ncbi:MAG TPA: FliM/FliN family flagellar motor switch protein [Terracidiphilus sp.]|jgi:flagellar motor switch protein FliN/FliY|nr:FliM/FliN family flagellar motor switch protein [Terracidiphilus sp.]